MTEDQTKAALLYNFIKNISWPNEKKLDNIKVVFLSNNKTFYYEFNKIAKAATIRNKPIRTQLIRTSHPLSNMQVLVVDKSFNSKIESIIQQLQKQKVLLVSEGLADKNKLMVNYSYPDSRHISFEINKSNIIYQGLSVSNDILLHGGTEIEVATLYKQMEASLNNLKTDVNLQQNELNRLLTTLASKNNDIKNKSKIISKQQRAVTSTKLALLKQQEKITEKEQLLASQEQQLQSQEIQLQNKESRLSLITDELSKNTQQLNASKKSLMQQRDNMQKMQKDISYNQKILDQQNKELKLQKNSLAKQGQTINSQRNIIFFALLILLLVAAYIVFRQKQDIRNKHQLLKAEAELVKAQAISIEAYESTLKVKNDFLTAINHELRTPMHGIIGALQIAQSDDLNSMQNALSIINQSSEDMLSLIEDILAYTEAQSQQCLLKPEVISQDTLLQPLYIDFLAKCEAKKLTLEWSVNDELPEYFFIDNNKFNKVLKKVIGNAVKFTEKGFVKVKFSLAENANAIPETPQELHKLTLLIDIIDSGPGIIESEKSNIFEPFQQHESGYNRRYGGLGIGLALCEKLIYILQGKIALLDSKQGSHFQLSIPFQIPSISDVNKHISNVEKALVTITASEKQPAKLNPEKSLSILIVEDNPVNQTILQRMLIKLGYHTLLAKHGDEALSLLEHNTPAVIIMDLQMPVMDGFSCTQHIRARKDDKSKTPIIALTANLIGSQESRCLDAGMNAYLGKPIKLDVLQKTLENFISV